MYRGISDRGPLTDKGPLRGGHNKNNLSTKDTLQSPICSFSHTVDTFEQPLYKGQNG